MEPLEQLRARAEASVPGAVLEIVPNACPADPPSLRVDPGHALAVAWFLRDDPQLRLDYASNVTGVDWPETVTKEKARVKRMVDGVVKEFETVVEKRRPGFLEAVYHLYSMELKQGPVILRQRTGDRDRAVTVASLTPVWRGAEFQEREIYDLYGIRFEGHQDLRRLLMWEGFEGHPMRRDYVEPDDYDYEPTPHADVLEKARKHYPAPPAS